MSTIPKSASAIKTTGLFMPADFPVASYEAIHLKIAPYAEKYKAIYNEFAGAWNAISYRYFQFVECDEVFTLSISTYGAGPPADERYRQERDLFGFFNGGFSTFEAFFYGAFAAGAFLEPKQFPIATPQDQRRITAASTIAAYRAAFPNDPVIKALEATVSDLSYLEIRDVRNILSHRTAPGRTIHMAIGDDPAPDQWKLANIVLDRTTTTLRRQGASKLLTMVLGAYQTFSDQHF